MKSFFKYTLASVVGVILGFLIIGLIMFGTIGAIISSASQDEEVEVKKNSLLTLQLNRPIVDRANKNPLQAFDFQAFKVKKEIGLNTLLHNIDKAAKDDNIQGIVLSAPNIQAGYAKVEEIRDALLDFKRSGKYVVSHNNMYTQKAYYLASVADTLYGHPEGELAMAGLNAEIMFFSNTLDKLGVEPIILRHGKFKSAVEPFIMEKMSEANKKQTRTYLNSLWNHALNNISISRDIAMDKLNLIIDNLYTFDISEALKYNLVDKLIYEDEFIELLKKRTERKEDEDLRTVSLGDYNNAPEPKDEDSPEGLADDEIAVVYASGQIAMQSPPNDGIGGENYASIIRDARKDDDIKAIVLRVNSPGGSALASDLIWREVKLAREQKPVIVSMGDVAASGGYYIACAADTIVANENTITGSIGVFGLLFNAKELLNKKLGITTDNVKTNKHADIGSFTRPMRENEKAILMKNIEDIYDTFISHVAEGRGMSKARIDSIGQGRVWSGINAKENGLIDEFGGLQRAIEIAAEKAGIEHYRLTSLPKQKDPIKEIMNNFTGGSAAAAIVKEKTGKFHYYLDAMQTISEMEGVQARLPYKIRLN